MINARNARYFTPALTTIHQPDSRRAKAAFHMLLDRIVNKREMQSIEATSASLSNAAPWLTARSATIVVNHPLRSLLPAPAATPYSASHYRQYTQATRLTQATYHFAAMSDNMPNPQKGFSRVLTYPLPLIKPRFGECVGTIPMHNPAEIQVADDSQSGTTSLFWLSSNQVDTLR